jgi:FtsP/CotA-like multicopper oxidase with cupredoxin domain
MRIRRGLVFRLGLALLSSALVPWLLPATARAAPPGTGVVCTTGPTFSLETREGYIQLPDANTLYMWGYSPGGAAFQHPGPVLCVNQGDMVTVVLTNHLPEPVSIIFPGQENVLANGAPAQPQFDGTGKLTSLTNVAAANGGTITYSFVASSPGSFVYESGTMPQKQVRMGLFGALVVRPTLGANFAYGRADSRFTPEEEFMVLLSDLDPYQHQAVEGGHGFNLNNYHPRYWLINGRGFPDSIADNAASFLPDQPYGALARIHPFDAATHPFPGRIHYLNVGAETYPFHPHGNNGLVIGRDGRPLAGPSGQDLSFEKFAINIGPGQTWDVLFRWYDAEAYDPTANPVPVTVPSVANMEYGVFFSGSPYLGQTGPLPPGASTLNQCGEYYIISHNHALFQITSWGVTLSGPITYVRVDPPAPNNCPP